MLLTFCVLSCDALAGDFFVFFPSEKEYVTSDSQPDIPVRFPSWASDNVQPDIPVRPSWAVPSEKEFGTSDNVGLKILKILPGDYLRYYGKNDTGALVQALAGNYKITMPWHDVKIVAGTPAVEERYRATMKRLKSQYDDAVAQRVARQRQQAAAAAAAAEYAASPAGRMDDLERRLAVAQRAAQEKARRDQSAADFGEWERQREQRQQENTLRDQEKKLEELEFRLRNRR